MEGYSSGYLDDMSRAEDPQPGPSGINPEVAHRARVGLRPVAERAMRAFYTSELTYVNGECKLVGSSLGCLSVEPGGLPEDHTRSESKFDAPNSVNQGSARTPGRRALRCALEERAAIAAADPKAHLGSQVHRSVAMGKPTNLGDGIETDDRAAMDTYETVGIETGFDALQGFADSNDCRSQ